MTFSHHRRSWSRGFCHGFSPYCAPSTTASDFCCFVAVSVRCCDQRVGTVVCTPTLADWLTIIVSRTVYEMPICCTVERMRNDINGLITTFCAHFSSSLFSLCRKACGNNYLRQVFAAEKKRNEQYGTKLLPLAPYAGRRGAGVRVSFASAISGNFQKWDPHPRTGSLHLRLRVSRLGVLLDGLERSLGTSGSCALKPRHTLGASFFLAIFSRRTSAPLV
jgi:hypothetical protein